MAEAGDSAAKEEDGASPRRQGAMAMALSSFGLMADIYDFTVINLVRPSLEAEYGPLSPLQDSLLTGAPLLGAILGQVGFGAVADHCGRKMVFVATASLIGGASLASALAVPGMFGLSIYHTLAIFRLIMGLGIGGEYPLAAATTAENVDVKGSGQALAITFSGMAVGQLLGPGVVILLTAGFGFSNNLVWRWSFGFGAILAGLCVVLRYSHLQETRSWRHTSEPGQEDGEGGGGGARPRAASKAGALLAMRWSLAGAAGGWFLYDVVTYGVGLFTTTIFPTKPGLQAAETVLLIAVISLPGTLASLVITGYVRMRQLQILGLGLMMLCFLTLTWLYDAERRGDTRFWLCLAVFSLMRCFDTMGPGVTTFAIPGQVFPTRVRGTAHGISAAAGKVGAVVGTVTFPYLDDAAGIQVVMGFMAVVCAATIVWTWVFVPLYAGDQLEEIAKHDAGMTLEKQATLAERILFDPESSKGEALPFASAIRNA